MDQNIIESCSSLKEYVLALINVHFKDNLELCQFLDMIDCKRRSKILVEKLGLVSPKQFHLIEEFEAFDLSKLPDEFVVKPCWGSSNRGVRICKLEGEAIVDLVNNKSFSRKEFLFSYYDESEQFSNYSKEFTIEERVYSKTNSGIFPMDYKIYTAGGKAICIMQRDVNLGPEPEDWRYKYWLKNGISIESVNSKLTYEPNFSLPKNWRELIETAEKIASSLPIPFVRVDLFLNDTGVFFCELTPKPGTYKTYDEDFDLFVGRQIRKALPWQITEIRDFLSHHEHLIW